MLILGLRLIGMPIMGLQTGTKLAITKSPIIDPSNLRIVAYEVDGPLLAEKPSFLRMNDVREISPVGMIIDSNDEFIGAEDVIKIKELLDIGFEIIGLTVIDESKHKLGKVNNYNIDATSFTIQQLNVKPGIIKSLGDTELLIHRSQIIEINNKSIIVKAAAKKLEPIIEPQKLTYMNPFRSTSPQVDNSELNSTPV
jgi:uncharacterized protein YrrD